MQWGVVALLPTSVEICFGGLPSRSMSRLHVIRLLAVTATALATLVVGATDVSARVVPDGGPHLVVPGPGSGIVFEIASNVERDEYFAVWPSTQTKDIVG